MFREATLPVEVFQEFYSRMAGYVMYQIVEGGVRVRQVCPHTQVRKLLEKYKDFV